MSESPEQSRPESWEVDLPARVLVPLDRSAFAESALLHTRAAARIFGAEIRLLTVCDPELSGATSGTSAECRLQLLEAEQYLDGVCGRLSAEGFDAETAVREGDPATEIVKSAVELGADLVAMAARPRRERQQLLSRGVAQSVLATGISSFLVARGGWPGGSAASGSADGYGMVVVALDGSPPSHGALGMAVAIARAEGAEIQLVHVEPPSTDSASASEGPGVPRAGGRETAAPGSRDRQETPDAYLARMKDAVSRTGVTVTFALRRAENVADTIEDAARSAGADLLILGAHGRGRAESPYGHCARRLFIHSPVPVLVVQDRPVNPGPGGVETPRVLRRPKPPRPGRQRPDAWWSLRSGRR